MEEKLVTYCRLIPGNLCEYWTNSNNGVCAHYLHTTERPPFIKVVVTKKEPKYVRNSVGVTRFTLGLSLWDGTTGGYVIVSTKTDRVPTTKFQRTNLRRLLPDDFKPGDPEVTIYVDVHKITQKTYAEAKAETTIPEGILL